MDPGSSASSRCAIGEPAGWVADRSRSTTGRTTRSPSSRTRRRAMPGRLRRRGPGARRARRRRCRPSSFDPAELGDAPARRGELGKLLVTGDSLAMPLDIELARRLGRRRPGCRGRARPHVGTGISKTGLVDWGRLSTDQVGEPDGRGRGLHRRERGFRAAAARRRGDRVLRRRRAAEYAYRVRRMMNTYRRGGRARVYWLTLPAPRDGDRQEIARSVNAAIEVAAQPYEPRCACSTWRSSSRRAGAIATPWRSTAGARSCASRTAST